MDVHVPLGYIGTRDIACRFRELTFLYFPVFDSSWSIAHDRDGASKCQILPQAHRIF